MRERVALRYEAMVAAGEIVPDPLQRALVARLDALNQSLHERPRKGGALRRLVSRRKRAMGPRGLYVWGGVGRGKTLLMDIFFEVAATGRRRRVHFHEFMAEVHDRIAALRRNSADGAAGDPIPRVAGDIAEQIELLCFDEFAVYDIADAMILGRLFQQLFARGVTVVATTNVAPDELYKDGLNRALFLPFIALLKEHMDIFHLDAPRDYRLDSEGGERRYVTPLDADADACLDAHFRYLSGSDRGEPIEITHRGRNILVPEAAAGVARFKFDDLCSRPLGSSDFLRIAERFHTIIFSHLPILSAARRNEAKRLINLIDTLYDKRVRLVVSAEAEPDRLWRETRGAEAFEFRRTVSRLMEMRSDAYWNEAGDAGAEKRSPGAMARAP